MDQYQKGPVIGEGTYGTVLCAVHKATGQHVALKKVKMRNNKEGINMSVLRELKALKALKSPHIVHLLDVFTTKSSLVLVFEYMEWSLEDVIKDKGCPLAAADVKAYMQMLLQALAFVHSNQVAHRDIKPDNMLIDSNGVMKLADFGLARFLDPSADSGNSRLTPQVFGRWYRPPELLMGCSSYGCAVDMWAAGCVLAEMLIRRPWFPASCDMEQLDRIFKALGVPTLESWPGMAELPNKILFKPAPGQQLEQVFPQASPECLDLLRQLMQYEPENRITAAAALQHPYFSSTPAATAPADLPKPSSVRGNRSNVTSIPALVQEMLARPDMLVRQQQPAPDLCSSRSLFPFSSTSFSGRCLQGPAVQQPAGAPDSLLGGPTSTSNAASRSSKGAIISGFEAFTGEREQQQQQQGIEQLGRSFSGVSDEAAASHPLNCRLSFGSIYDEHSGMHEQPSRPGSVEVGQEAPSAAGSDGQQQQGLRRPSPGMHLQAPGKGSMRPPLHRTSSAHAGATPVSARPTSAGPGDVVMPSGAATTAGTAKRKVSDLAAALCSAAATGGNGAAPADAAGNAAGFPGLLGCAQRRHDQGLPVRVMGGFNSLIHTPAARHQGSSRNMPGPAAEDTDMLCPTSLGTSVNKRPRAMFEAAADAAHLHGDAGQHQQMDALEPGMQQQEQQQQQQGAGPMSVGRRILRGRRSSMGCCNMEMDGLQHQQQQEQQQLQLQHSVVGLMPPPVAHTQHHNHSTTKHARFSSSVPEQLGGSQSEAAETFAHASEDAKQQRLESFLEAGRSGSSWHLQGDCGSSGALQLLPPWHQLGAAGIDHNRSNASADVGLPDNPMSLDQQYKTVVGGHGNHLAAPSTGGETNATDLPVGADSVGPCTSQRLGCLIGGLQEGLPGYADVDGVTPGIGFTEEELAMMDPHQLAEWANQWKPIVQSAEKRYLKERKLQMDEALLQASQPDNPDSTFSPDFHLKQPSMFRSPLTDTLPSGLPCMHRALLHRDCSGVAAASDAHNDLATAADSNRIGPIGMVVSSEGHDLQQAQCAAAGTALTPA